MAAGHELEEENSQGQRSHIHHLRVLRVCSQNEFTFDIMMSLYGPSFPFFLAIVPNDAAITLWNTAPKVGCDELSAYVSGGKNVICLRGTHTQTHTHTSAISHLF